MISIHYKAVVAAGLSTVAILGVSACSSKSTTESSSSKSSAPASSSSSTLSQAPASTGAAADPAANLVGTGCDGYAKANPSGPASVTGMAQDPVASAASHNPLLTTLTKALSGQLNPKVNLVETLNSNPGLTVFAPTDDAFAKLDTATVEKLKVDSDLLTKILTYHVVEGQNSPTAVVGAKKTLEGGSVNVTGAGPELKFDTAGLVCGGVKTANATVYLIDTVLTPPAA